MKIEIYVPDGRKGSWEIETFKLTKAEADAYNEAESKHLKRYIAHDVEYKQLLRYSAQKPAGYPVMSNIPAEVADHMPFIEAAHGNVLLFGLGLGMVVQALIEKKSVNSITIVEIDPEVIELSGTYYQNVSKKIQIHQADALYYMDENRYDAIWFDIWDRIAPENLYQMEYLRERWVDRAPVQMCWAEAECTKLLKIRHGF